MISLKIMVLLYWSAEARKVSDWLNFHVAMKGDSDWLAAYWNILELLIIDEKNYDWLV